jgi:signal transduction histidine kinase
VTSNDGVAAFSVTAALIIARVLEIRLVESKAGLGFVSMQERLRALHGTIRVDSAPSRGTKIDAWVPPTMLPSARNDVVRQSETA